MSNGVRCFHTNGNTSLRCERNAALPHKYCEYHMNEAKCPYCTDGSCGRHCKYVRTVNSRACGVLLAEYNKTGICITHKRLWCPKCENKLLCGDGRMCQNIHCTYPTCRNLSTHKVADRPLCALHEHTVCRKCTTFGRSDNSNCLFCHRYVCSSCNFQSLCANRVCCLCIPDIDISELTLVKYIDIYIEYSDFLSHTLRTYGINDYTSGFICGFIIPPLTNDIITRTKHRLDDDINTTEADILELTDHIIKLNQHKEKINQVSRYV